LWFVHKSVRDLSGTDVDSRIVLRVPSPNWNLVYVTSKSSIVQEKSLDGLEGKSGKVKEQGNDSVLEPHRSTSCF